MTQLWPEGQPIAIVLDELAEPGAFTWQGQRYQVEAITRRWRVDVEWWRDRVWRAYYKLSTTTGLLVVLYQDLISGEWYLQRLYD
ncbi:MAG: hypothetical protein L0332_11895 [Chloroflexi bacterium]|nr:hypothetical protein [Chloroflexota bacterium]MCI0649915.1 hypothetical protein [Chloroflexota bacterium]MCI0727410.1 hypothetical protein [Chloroflexota bacterium]